MSEPPRPSVVTRPSGPQPLEARDDRDLPLVETGGDRAGIDLDDPRPAVRGVGPEAGLPAEERAGAHADRLQRDRQQPDGDLLAGGDHLIVLGHVEARGIQLVHPADQPVGGARHRRDDDGQPLARLDVPLDARRDVANTL